MTDFETRKTQAADWFRVLRDTITTAFEALEQSTDSDLPAGRFEVSPTTRDEGRGGGGIMSVMRGGRLFEKVGVNWSAVHGVLNPRAQKAKDCGSAGVALTAIAAGVAWLVILLD